MSGPTATEKATSSIPGSEHLPHEQETALHRATNYPVVKDTLSYTHQCLESYRLTAPLYHGVGAVSTSLLKQLEPLSHRFEGPLHTADSYGNATLDYIEEKLPQVKLETSELVASTLGNKLSKLFKPEERVVERLIEVRIEVPVEKIIYVNRTVEVEVPVEKETIVERIIEVEKPVEVVRYVHRCTHSPPCNRAPEGGSSSASEEEAEEGDEKRDSEPEDGVYSLYVRHIDPDIKTAGLVSLKKLLSFLVVRNGATRASLFIVPFWNEDAQEWQGRQHNGQKYNAGTDSFLCELNSNERYDLRCRSSKWPKTTGESDLGQLKDWTNSLFSGCDGKTRGAVSTFLHSVEEL